MDYLYALILGVVEGLTEFLPISSTGHLIVTTRLLGFPTAAVNTANPDVFRDTFEIFIQLGAILAVIAFYRRDLISQARRLPRDSGTQRFWLNVLIAFLPAAVVGFLLRDFITENLFRPEVVGLSLIVGGVVFLVIEAGKHEANTHGLENISTLQAVIIGLAQLSALIPGVSRSGASIIGGLLLGLDRPTATGFSFYLAIPTLGAATIYQLFSALREGAVQAEHLPLFAVGTVMAFFVAWAAVAWLLRFVANNNFRVFGVYRIITGLLILALVLFTTVFTR